VEIGVCFVSSRLAAVPGDQVIDSTYLHDELDGANEITCISTLSVRNMSWPPRQVEKVEMDDQLSPWWLLTITDRET